MDQNMEEIEIVFAQKLAAGEQVIRKRAFRLLRNWIKEESGDKRFEAESMGRLCKGLHYALWMQDDMLIQEKLADNIASLIGNFRSNEHSAQFIMHMLLVLSNEWHRIDRWRMDKFLMLIRRLLRAIFKRLKRFGWDESLVKTYLDAFNKCVISPDNSFCEGLKYHFASVYLDELDGAGGLTSEQVTRMLEPYFNLLAYKNISENLFDSVLDEIFVTILHDYAEQRINSGHSITRNEKDVFKRGEVENDGDRFINERIKFEYGIIGEELLRIGGNHSVITKRRKKLYRLARRFMAAEQGGEVFEEPVPSSVLKKPAITKADMKHAVSKFISFTNKHISKTKKTVPTKISKRNCVGFQRIYSNRKVRQKNKKSKGNKNII